MLIAARGTRLRLYARRRDPVPVVNRVARFVSRQEDGLELGLVELRRQEAC